MRDRIYMVLGFVGFVILAVVVVTNYNSGNNTNYEVGSAYEPLQRSDLVSSQELYNQLTGARSLTCPSIDMSKSKDSLVVLTSIWGSYYDHPNSLNNMFITNSRLSDDDSILRPMTEDFESVLHLSTLAKSSDTVVIKDLFTVDIFGGDEYIELVAPFGFQFGNLNSTIKIEDNGSSKTVIQDIVITNTKGNCRITFGNVANWFCAGDIGTSSVISNASDGLVDWSSHHKAHHSIIGNSPNAVSRGGVSGDVFGYAKQDTTITIEVFTDGAFRKVSLYKLIMPTG